MVSPHVYILGLDALLMYHSFLLSPMCLMGSSLEQIRSGLFTALQPLQPHIGCSTPQSGHKGLSRALRSLIILEQAKTHLSRALRSLMTSRTTRCAVYSVRYIRRSHLYSITATRVKIIKRSGKPRVQLPSKAELKEFRMVRK